MYADKQHPLCLPCVVVIAHHADNQHPMCLPCGVVIALLLIRDKNKLCLFLIDFIEDIEIDSLTK